MKFQKWSFVSFAPNRYPPFRLSLSPSPYILEYKIHFQVFLGRCWNIIPTCSWNHLLWNYFAFLGQFTCLHRNFNHVRLSKTSIPDLFLWHGPETGSMPRIYQPRWPFTTVIGNKNSKAPKAVHFSRQIFYFSYFPFAFFLYISNISRCLWHWNLLFSWWGEHGCT